MNQPTIPSLSGEYERMYRERVASTAQAIREQADAFERVALDNRPNYDGSPSLRTTQVARAINGLMWMLGNAHLDTLIQYATDVDLSQPTSEQDQP
jgi:hypothetical protein